VAYDARGWGQSDKAPASYKLADLADEVLSLVKVLGLKGYVHVAHSFGGKIAQLVASRRPKGLLGLVLVAPAPPTPLRLPDEMRETQIHAYDNRENVLQTIRFLTAHTPSPEIVEQIIEDSMSGSRDATLREELKQRPPERSLAPCFFSRSEMSLCGCHLFYWLSFFCKSSINPF
jgi:pimeloyl-ACP methyl ester carboxylesterase